MTKCVFGALPKTDTDLPKYRLSRSYPTYADPEACHVIARRLQKRARPLHWLTLMRGYFEGVARFYDWLERCPTAELKWAVTVNQHLQDQMLKELAERAHVELRDAVSNSANYPANIAA